jgi:hypothetical protein
MKLIDFWREESVRFDAILFDIDGTLVYGPQPIPGAAEFLALLRRDGTPFFFLTNDGDHTRRQKSGFLNRAGMFGGPANTTYGENTGVLALSKVYDPRVVRLAAIYAIILSFSPKFDALVNSIPAAIVGGVSFILYGMISAGME